MAETGIGASVQRKEDQRFITGKGQYTDDINRPGQTWAYFVRSPHAHANIKTIDAAAALATPGVLAVFTGEDIAKDKVGGLICGWMIHSKDGSPMKAGAHPALAQGKVRYVGDHVAVVIAETLAQAKDAAEKVVVDYERAAGRRRHGDQAEPGSRRSTPKRPTTRSIQWHLGDKAEVDAAFAGRQARDQDRPRQQPADPQRHGAARRHRRLRRRAGELHALHHQPEPARRAAGAVGLHRHRARAQAARDRARRGRRLRLQDLHLRRGDRVPVGRQEGRPAREVDGRPHRGVPLRRAWPRPRHPGRAGGRRRAARSSALRAKTKANLGGYLSTFASSVPTYLYAPLLSGQYDIPAIYCEVDGVYTNTAPVDAYRGAGRPEATFVVERLVEVAARELGKDPAEFRRKNFIRRFPHPTPVIMTYDAGDYAACLDKALELADYKGFGARKAASAKQRQAARPRLLGLHRGLRHRAARGGRLARRRRRPVGIGRGARQSDRLGRGADRLAQPRPGPRDDLRPARLASGSASPSSRSRSCTATPTRCSSAWAPTARAPARSACRRSPRRSTR